MDVACCISFLLSLKCDVQASRGLQFATTMCKKEGRHESQMPKKESKTKGCKLQALSNVTKLWPSYLYHYFVFSPFTKSLLSNFFSLPHQTPYVCIFLGDKLRAFNKFYMSSSSPIINNTYLSPNEKMVPIFTSHDRSINVDNLLQANGKLHPNEVILVINDDSYV